MRSDTFKSQLITSVHSFCYCTVHVYVVIPFYDSMGYSWMEANKCSFWGLFLFCWYLYCRCSCRSNYQRVLVTH